MASSRIPRIALGDVGTIVAPRTPGPLGHNDAASPNLNRVLPGDTPGPLGTNGDWADALARGKVIQPDVPLKSNQCACNRDLTIDELAKIYSKQSRQVCALYLPFINAAFKEYNINTCLRKSHFLAQLGHESGELRHTSEILRKGVKESDVYDGYKGRGLIQITYESNYRAYGKRVKRSFLGSDRTELEKPQWATDSAGWYWTSGSGKDLNCLADDNDLLAITAQVNGGFNGFEDRRKRLEKSFEVLNVRRCKNVVVTAQSFSPFPHSAIFNNRVYAFAWGCWNDTRTGKTGVVKSADERKLGYKRYLELSESGKKSNNSHYGFSPEEMLALAKEGAK